MLYSAAVLQEPALQLLEHSPLNLIVTLEEQISAVQPSLPWVVTSQCIHLSYRKVGAGLNWLSFCKLNARQLFSGSISASEIFPLTSLSVVKCQVSVRIE